MLTIRLLGPPVIENDDGPLPPPRGRKAWALLAYVVLSPSPPSRQRLAELLFGQADDPLGALRWSLASLRKALAVPEALRGDPVVAALGDDVTVDVWLLDNGSDDDLPLELEGELLEGVHIEADPQLDTWLLTQRHRIGALVEARMRQSATGRLAAGRGADAIPYAVQAVARNPLEQGNHEILVRSLAMAGDRTSALQQVALSRDLLQRELGIEISPTLEDAAMAPMPRSATTPALRGVAAAVSQLDAGRAAIAAGAADAGIQCLRRAVAEAARCGDAGLQARALVALGGALVHALRGRDEEGALALREAIPLAEHAGDSATVVTAWRELGFVDVQAGRRQTADQWLTKAQQLADGDEQLAPILGVRGMNASDQGDYTAAYAFLDDSVERALRGGDERQQAWSLSIRGRAHLLRGEDIAARRDLGASLELIDRQRWIAFRPWSVALLAEVDLRSGAAVQAVDGFEQAWSLGCQLQDPCWEAMGARGLGLASRARGDVAGAHSWFEEAVARSVRVPDRYQWVHAHTLDASLAASLDERDLSRSQPLVGTLATLAARCDMQEMLVRAHLHRHRLGEASALQDAQSAAAGIESPALAALLDEAG
ncbi:BTAD domain-containing putative transcriptional regulator [Luteipulveratus mongoliensis]|uniref:Bacterial transcriptional activator domain-containing protein n=1 Tax=Luteipulveratus mongoliensis TaxID=571913 RepID=A0A0K1JFF4_9MICO|nr:BTAD domain-containing putative transcriptional regulator [Luteipulveratus mongoliensis]AKU15439.1 hypothetical protein VV02_05445 [Luteipulveratus mongoliensis]